MDLVNHLFVTPQFLILGRVNTGGKRLTSFLQSLRKPFLPLEDLTMMRLDRDERILASRGFLRSQEILFAHEFIDLAGDEHLKSLASMDDGDFGTVSFNLNEPRGCEVIGRCKSEALNPMLSDGFFVIGKPEFRGLEQRREREFEQLRKLSYGILNRAYVHCFFEYK